MSWIQENKFAAALAGASLAGAIIIAYFGFNARGKYSRELEGYQSASEQIEEFKNFDLFPEGELIVTKRESLNKYREQIDRLQKTFDKFRQSGEEAAISPQEFQDRAKSASEEVIKACAESKTELPEGFFLGFEAYNANLPRSEATGALAYELGALKELALAASNSGVSRIINLHRPKNPEEDGGKWEPGDGATFRAFPMEFTIKGTPKAVRETVNTMMKSADYYYTIRSARIINEKAGAPPSKTDARFDPVTPAPGTAPGTAPKPADPFGGFVLPDEPAEEPAPAPTSYLPPDPSKLPQAAQAAAPAAPAAGAGGGRVLQQVLGNEEVQVFMRIDVLRFLPAVKLPEVPN